MVEAAAVVEDDQEFSEEFQCAICWQVMFKPVTTPCGHTFCKECLENALAQRRECTLCKTKIFESSYANLQVNFMVMSIIEKKYPNLVAQRQKEHEELLAKRKEEIKQREEQKSGQIPVVFSKAHVFKDMRASVNVDKTHRKVCRKLISNGGMGNPVAYLKIHFQQTNQPFCLIMRDNEAMNGFLVKVTYLEQRLNGNHQLLVQGLGRFSASRVYKEEQPPQEEEVKAQDASQQIWLAEGQMLNDINRFKLITEAEGQVSGHNADQVARLKSEYRQKLEENMERLVLIYTAKFNQKLIVDAKLRGVGGIREEAALKANINATFGIGHERVYGGQIAQLLRPGGQVLPEDELFEMVERESLYMLSTLEFQSREGLQLVFERNTDERILAMIQELQSEERGERRDRLFVWEISPEIKKQESLKQFQFLILMIVVLVITAYYRFFKANEQQQNGRYPQH